MTFPISIFWFRRDLRLFDNAGLYHALKAGNPVLSLFIFDTEILHKLENRQDPRVCFIHDTLTTIKYELNKLGSDLIVKYGKPADIFSSLIKEYNIQDVFVNLDYESYAAQRDKNIENILAEKAIKMFSYKDHVIFEKNEIVKDDLKPYTVFTPYKRKWLAKLSEKVDRKGHLFYVKSYPNEVYFDNFFKVNAKSIMPQLKDMGFDKSSIEIPSSIIKSTILGAYEQHRNFPAVNGTSRLGIHLRFGTLSIRELATCAESLNPTFLNELIWRDFYAMILFQFPYVANRSFRPEYDNIEWRNDEREFKAWCEGQTGYPIVDAGMRELLHTGYMHNRVRMIVASFLTKHLLIDWRWGEAWFADKLIDFDLASNNGGWQWAAGCGTDAAPYFRIFSPDAQTEKFDHDKLYIKRWVPEYGTDQYVKPVVDHKMARERCLAVFKRGLERSK
ncbi:MAG: deoxyribodipyrimidine photo-lyase [Saprospiraceae bacterium]|nr:deoxyribodipyrimidine photo-lyase [Saprospiraceae bacterium]